MVWSDEIGAMNTTYAHKQILTSRGVGICQISAAENIRQEEKIRAFKFQILYQGADENRSLVIMNVLHEYKLNHCEVIFREDCTVDQFIDVLEGNRKYIMSVRV